jgi:hypothetical protein
MIRVHEEKSDSPFAGSLLKGRGTVCRFMMAPDFLYTIRAPINIVAILNKPKRI